MGLGMLGQSLHVKVIGVNADGVQGCPEGRLYRAFTVG
jgi:hypothetical protein